MLQYLIFLVLAPAAITLTAGIGVYAWRHRSAPTARTLSCLSAAIAGWLTCNTLELLCQTEAGTLTWAKITYTFIELSAIAWLAFALDYTGIRRWLTPRRFGPLLIIPLIIVLLVYTNDLHGLIWSSYTFHHADGLVVIRMLVYGPAFWFQVGFNYLLVVIGAGLIGRAYLTAPPPFSQQARWAIIGAVMPLTVNLVYIGRLIPDIYKDYTPLAFALASAAFAVAIFRHHLLSLMPIAHRAVMDSMCEGMIVVDDLAQIVDLNPTARFIIGDLVDDVRGQPLAQVWPRWQTLKGAREVPGSPSREVWVERGTAKYCFDVRISLLADRRGRQTGQLILLRDVTRHKEIEEELRRFNLELQARNAELDAFAHTAAHDLKRPLSVILGFNQLAARRLAAVPDPDPFIEECVRTIERTGGKMADIVNELLMLASVRQAEVVPAPIDTAALVAAAHENLKTLAAERKATINQPDEWPRAMGHAQWIEQVWTNLLSNALKYGGNPPRIDLGAEPFTDPETGQAMIRYWVRDNGPGLTPEERNRLFTAFARMHPEQAEGHGLGLFLIRRIVEKLGGQVGVNTALGEGSLFYFSLPAAGAGLL